MRELETRGMADGADDGMLDGGLIVLTDRPAMTSAEMRPRKGDAPPACNGETDVVGVVHDHDGYVTGPFTIPRTGVSQRETRGAHFSDDAGFAES